MIGEHLREAMRQWTSGVTVVTTTYRTMPHGMTVNSFSSISLDPPAIAVSMTTSTRTCKYVLASGYFGVHILSQNQQHLADLFSGRGVDESNRFSHVAHAFGIHEIPQLNESMALLQCRVMYTHPLKNSTSYWVKCWMCRYTLRNTRLSTISACTTSWEDKCIH